MRQLYLDCDGVLADFDEGAELVFGMHPRKYEYLHGSKEFWRTLHETSEFYAELPLMLDARALYNACAHWNPIILTGCPQGGWAQAQKLRWRDRNFPGVNMITTLSKNKRDHAKPGDVLVDDMEKYRHLWEEMGGVFVLYTRGMPLPKLLSSIRVAMTGGGK